MIKFLYGHTLITCVSNGCSMIELQLNGHQIKVELNGSAKEPNTSIYFFFPPITQWCSVSDDLFTGGRGVSDFKSFKILLVKY